MPTIRAAGSSGIAVTTWAGACPRRMRARHAVQGEKIGAAILRPVIQREPAHRPASGEGRVIGPAFDAIESSDASSAKTRRLQRDIAIAFDAARTLPAFSGSQISSPSQTLPTSCLVTGQHGLKIWTSKKNPEPNSFAPTSRKI